MGCAVGRYANRIAEGRIRIDGKTYDLSKNMEHCQLHGGKEGFDKKVWEPVSEGNSPLPFVVFRYRSADGEEGFPGNLEVQVRFELSPDDELSYAYTAVTDQPTAINLTHHGYFNLNSGNGNIKDHRLTIYSDRVLEQDENLVTNGDFRQPRAIAEACDKSFVISSKPDANGLMLAAEAESLQSGTKLRVYTTDPVVHFYAGGGMQPVIGKNKIQYGPFSGFCLETHKHPNAINIPRFPNTILRPGETYYQKTVYKVVH
jgi:aldose 1-epimerase